MKVLSLSRKGRVAIHGLFGKIISLGNIFAAWREFQKGKMKRSDVLRFAENAESHLIDLHRDLSRGAYQHGDYIPSVVYDPKKREISKASVRDRVLHRAVIRIVEPLFDRTFVFDSYSSRRTKGTHKAMDRFNEFARKLSQNRTATVWVLQCDIRRYFDSINHGILGDLFKKKIENESLNSLVGEIIGSFNKSPNIGVPLGNLTSQLFSNIGLDRFDQFVKRILRVKHYIRYADDFVILSRDEKYLRDLLSVIRKFLRDELRLEIHPDKIFLRKWHQGIDFLGWVHFPHYRVLRTKTKRRMFAKVLANPVAPVIASYRGLLKHGNARKLAALLPEPRK